MYVWLVASLILDAPMPLGCRLLNHMALQPAMANPFGAATVREFWGRRYNQIVSSLLQASGEHTRELKCAQMAAAANHLAAQITIARSCRRKLRGQQGSLRTRHRVAYRTMRPAALGPFGLTPMMLRHLPSNRTPGHPYLTCVR